MNKLSKKLAYITLGCICVFNILFYGSDSFMTYATEPAKVIVGGVPFGVKFYTEGIVVVGFSDITTSTGTVTPAYDAGLRINDRITHVNGSPVNTSLELVERIEKSPADIEITYVRNGEVGSVVFSPAVSSEDGRKKTGMWVRDTTAGIGTVTYAFEDTGMFGGLGHGICDGDTGELLKMERGIVLDVQISGISRGMSGAPGELKGYFTSDKSGVLLGNTVCGVFGVFSDIPKSLANNPRLEIAKRDEVRVGKATIMCTVDGGGCAEYEIEIKEINRDSKDNRSYLIEVTDGALLEKTGGIVQGMSGSPIIQNGKLVGAVTHVLVNDPTRGYGIFIENMLEAAG